MPDTVTQQSAANPPRKQLRLFGLDGQHPFYLLYLLFWLIEPAQEPSARRWTLLGCAIAAFLFLYVQQHGSRLKARRWYATGAMLVLALVYVPINVSAFGIYIYIASALPELVEEFRPLLGLLLAECAVILVQAWLFHFSMWEWTIACPISVSTGMNLWHFHAQRRTDARLKMAHDEIEQLAKTAERERIARDLHDVLGHTLSLIAIKSELAERLLASDPERTGRELAEIQATARRALTEVRQTVSGYRSQGLEAEMQQAAAALAAAGVTVVSRPASLPRLPAQQEASLSLIVREAVTNIVRHAGAHSCTLALHADAHATVLEVCDDGRGCTGLEGNGLRGMRERVRDLGGTLLLRSNTGDTRGTTLRIALPAPVALSSGPATSEPPEAESMQLALTPTVTG